MAGLKREFYTHLSENLNKNETSKPTSVLHGALQEYFESDGLLLVQKLLTDYVEEKLKSFEASSNNSTEKDPDAFFNTKETCAFLKIGRTSLFNHTKNDPHFPKPKHIGRRIVYSKKSLIDYLNRVKYYQREPP